MKIDRSKFLFLASAIAMGACSSENTPTNVGGTDIQGDGSADTGTATDAAAENAAEASPDVVTPDANADSTDENDGGEAGAVGDAATETGADDGGDAAPTCDDSMGATVDCSTLNMDAGCGAFVGSACEGIVQNFKPLEAQEAFQCLQTANLNDCVNVSSCAFTSLPAGACASDATNTACAQCPDADSTTLCHLLLDGLSTTGFTTVTSCVESLSDGGFDCTNIMSCVESLF